MIAQRHRFHDMQTSCYHGDRVIEKFQLDPFLFNQQQRYMDGAEDDEYVEWEE